MKNIKLIVEYDGSDFSGWQIQPNVRTVAGVIEKALVEVVGEKVNLLGSGRTDAGVHATGQVANFRTKCPIPAEKYKYALRFILPSDISIVDSVQVHYDFHARFDAKRKVYRYKVYTGMLPKALLRRYSFFFPFELDEDLLKAALDKYVGKHDFSSFMARGANDFNVYKTIYRAEVTKKGDMYDFVFEGDAFLRNMVRIMVGTALYIACGRIRLSNIDMMFEGNKRDLGGFTVGPQGLYLEKVFY